MLQGLAPTGRLGGGHAQCFAGLPCSRGRFADRFDDNANECIVEAKCFDNRGELSLDVKVGVVPISKVANRLRNLPRQSLRGGKAGVEEVQDDTGMLLVQQRLEYV